MLESENEAWSERLLAMGLAVQNKVTALVQKAFRDGTSTLADAVSEEGGDRIYRIYRDVEATIEDAIGGWPAGCLPLLLIAEGMGHGFFNRQPWADVTLIAADKFLKELGFIEGEPTLAAPKTGEKLTKRP